MLKLNEEKQGHETVYQALASIRMGCEAASGIGGVALGAARTLGALALGGPVDWFVCGAAGFVHVVQIAR